MWELWRWLATPRLVLRSQIVHKPHKQVPFPEISGRSLMEQNVQSSMATDGNNVNRHL